MLAKEWEAASADDQVLFVERANELAVSGKAKGFLPGAVAKASANSAY